VRGVTDTAAHEVEKEEVADAGAEAEEGSLVVEATFSPLMLPLLTLLLLLLILLPLLPLLLEAEGGAEPAVRVTAVASEGASRVWKQ
jgi:hypothetical protein